MPGMLEHKVRILRHRAFPDRFDRVRHEEELSTLLDDGYEIVSTVTVVSYGYDYLIYTLVQVVNPLYRIKDRTQPSTVTS